MQFVKKSAKSNDNLWANIGWTLKFIWQSAPGLTLATVALTVIQSVLPLLGLYLTKLILDNIAVGMNVSAGPAAFKHISFLLLLLAAVFLLERAVSTVV